MQLFSRSGRSPRIGRRSNGTRLIETHSLAPVGIVAALAAEAKTLGRAARTEGSIQRLADGSLLAISGMGQEAAARAARALGAAGAAGLVSWGVAGGLDPRLHAGDLVLADRVLAPDGAAVFPSAAWRGALAARLAGRATIHAGSVLTTPQALDSVAAKALAFRTTGALAVDMESLAVGRAASEMALPFLAVRVIVDAAGDLLPAAVMAASRGGEVRLVRLLGELVLAPRDLAPMLRLAARYRAASRTLGAVASMGWRLPPGAEAASA
jgi:adenosylhomocysteine nucleosidase